MKVIHLRKTAKKFLERLFHEGFKGVRYCRLSVEGSDEPEPGEQTVAQKAKWDRNYVNFIAQPLLGGDLHDVEFDNSYTEIIVDYNLYRQDFEKEIKRVFGEDVKITCNTRLYEYEVYREDKIKN